jgi:hypothetical protein
MSVLQSRYLHKWASLLILFCTFWKYVFCSALFLLFLYLFHLIPDVNLQTYFLEIQVELGQ